MNCTQYAIDLVIRIIRNFHPEIIAASVRKICYGCDFKQIPLCGNKKAWKENEIMKETRWNIENIGRVQWISASPENNQVTLQPKSVFRDTTLPLSSIHRASKVTLSITRHNTPLFSFSEAPSISLMVGSSLETPPMCFWFVSKKQRIHIIL